MAQQHLLIPRSEGGTLDAIHYQISSESKKTDTDIDEKAPFVILCHGFTGDKTEWGRFTRTCERLLDEGFESVIFDFSGSGKNIREPITLSKQIQDLRDVYTWAQEQGYTWISTIGLSFGGLTSVIPDLPDRKCAILWAPALYFMRILGGAAKSLIRIIYSLFNPTIKQTSKNNDPVLIKKAFFFELKDLDIESILENFDLPCLIVQGKDDEQVKVENTREAFSHLPDDIDKKLVVIDNATHDFEGPQLEEFIDHSIAWLKKYL